MLFNSYIFIFLFLPVFLAGWQITAYANVKRLPLYLLIASFFFYGCFSLQWLFLLLLMASVNYFFGLALQESPGSSTAMHARGLFSRRAIFICGLVFNILPLLWFKYSWFILENIALLFDTSWQYTPPALPLGISFYTFIQIAWLVGVYRGENTPASFEVHTLFSCCFPWLMSGPLVRAQQMEWQFAQLGRLGSPELASGLTLFVIGLAKKAILADSLGFYADAVFNAASRNWPLSALEAWTGSLSYTFQLYFDFSGYTDMALGLGLMIGLKLPENFNSPYKATGIIEFWRRWHITLGSWLRDFLYIPLGGNRHGKARQYLNLFLTMLIGGFWHGAGWTYVVWGAMHGAMLGINHLFRSICREHNLLQHIQRLPVRLFCILATFFLLNITWVIFRAENINTALAIYKAMFAAPFMEPAGGDNGEATAYANIFNFLMPNHYFSGWLPLLWMLACFGICWFLPNSRQLMNNEAGWFSWRPTPAWGSILAVVCFGALAFMGRQSTFLYFQF